MIMEEITLSLSVDTYDRIVELMHEYGYFDITVDRFVEKLLIKQVYGDEIV